MRKSKLLLFSLLAMTIMLSGCSKIEKIEDTPINGGETKEEQAEEIRPDFDLVIPEDLANRNLFSATELKGENSKSDYIIIHDNKETNYKYQLTIPEVQSDLVTSLQDDVVILASRADSNFLLTHWFEPMQSEDHFKISEYSDEMLLEFLQGSETGNIILREERDNSYLAVSEIKEPEANKYAQIAILRDTDAEMIYYFAISTDEANYNKDEALNTLKGVTVFKYKTEAVESDSE